MNDAEKNDFIRFLVKELKAYSRELMAYQLFAHLLKQAGYTEVDELLAEARKDHALEKRLEKNFSSLEALLPQPSQGVSEMAKEFLEKWNSADEEPN